MEGEKRRLKKITIKDTDYQRKGNRIFGLKLRSAQNLTILTGPTLDICEYTEISAQNGFWSVNRLVFRVNNILMIFPTTAMLNYHNGFSFFTLHSSVRRICDRRLSSIVPMAWKNDEKKRLSIHYKRN